MTLTPKLRAELLETADLIDNRLGPLPGALADRLAVLLRQIAKEAEPTVLPIPEGKREKGGINQNFQITERPPAPPRLGNDADDD